MAPALPLEGGCMCGRHRYRVGALPLTLYACHCTDCQTQSGSAFGLSMTVERTAFEVLGTEPATVERLSDSGRVLVARYCPSCGTRLFNEPARAPHTVNVKPGTLDDTAWIRPVAHLWLRSAQAWFVPPEGALAYDRQPEDREPLNARFRALCAGGPGAPAAS